MVDKGKTKVNVESLTPLQVDYNAASSSVNAENTSCEVGGSSTLHNVTTPNVVVTQTFPTSIALSTDDTNSDDLDEDIVVDTEIEAKTAVPICPRAQLTKETTPNSGAAASSLTPSSGLSKRAAKRAAKATRSTLESTEVVSLVPGAAITITPDAKLISGGFNKDNNSGGKEVLGAAKAPIAMVSKFCLSLCAE